MTSATVTATSTVAGEGLVLGVGGALLVIGLLIALELVGNADRSWRHNLRRGLHVATAPMVFVFAVSVVARALSIIA